MNQQKRILILGSTGMLGHLLLSGILIILMFDTEIGTLLVK